MYVAFKRSRKGGSSAGESSGTDFVMKQQDLLHKTDDCYKDWCAVVASLLFLKVRIHKCLDLCLFPYFVHCQYIPTHLSTGILLLSPVALCFCSSQCPLLPICWTGVKTKNKTNYPKLHWLLQESIEPVQKVNICSQISVLQTAKEGEK